MDVMSLKLGSVWVCEVFLLKHRGVMSSVMDVMCLKLVSVWVYRAF